MSALLFTVGIIVFFMTVYGTVMVGGHALRTAEAKVTPPDTVRADTPTLDEPGSAADAACAEAATVFRLADVAGRVSLRPRERAHRSVS